MASLYLFDLDYSISFNLVKLNYQLLEFDYLNQLVKLLDLFWEILLEVKFLVITSTKINSILKLLRSLDYLIQIN